MVNLIQIYFHWKYFIGLVKYCPSANKNTYEPGISIVVAARNEAHRLPKLVSSLLRQEYGKFDIIIVNDRSKDSSQSILEDLASQNAKLKVIQVTELPTGWNGKKNALKAGIEASRYDLILLTDADCLPKSDQWICKMANSFTEKTEIVLGFSPYKNEPGFLNQFIQYETLLTGVQYLSFSLKKQGYMGVGRNLAYRKNLFDSNGFSGYEHKTGGDDDLFVNKHAKGDNIRIQISEAAQTISFPKHSWLAYFRQKLRHLSAGVNYRKKDQTRLGAFALSTLLGWIMLFWAVFTGFNIVILLVIFSIRSLSFYIIFTRSGRKLDVKMAYWALPLLDLCYNLYYPIVGLIALMAKKVKWS